MKTLPTNNKQLVNTSENS